MARKSRTTEPPAHDPVAEQKAIEQAARRDRFLAEYLVDLSVPKACKRAGVPTIEGYAWLADESVQAAVLIAEAERAAKVSVTADRVLEELARIAFLDVGELLDDQGNVLPLSQMPEAARRAIAGLEVFEEHAGMGEDRQLIGFTKKLKLADKLRALELLGKHLAMWVDRVEVDDKGAADRIRAARDRAAARN